MPQANQTITVTLAQQPSGILRELISPRSQDLVGEVQTRLNNVSGLLYVLSTNEEFDPALRGALSAIDLMLRDTASLLSVIPARGVV